MTKHKVTIRAAGSCEDLAKVRDLFVEYANWLGVDLSFQNFSEELATFPGPYGEPNGSLLLASVDEAPAGCVALRDLGRGIGEMKRLYVRSQFHGMGVGRGLASRIIEEARNRGYRSVRLDTLPSMQEAMMLYRSLGFRPITAYAYSPIEGAIFMELALAAAEKNAY